MCTKLQEFLLALVVAAMAVITQGELQN